MPSEFRRRGNVRLGGWATKASFRTLIRPGVLNQLYSHFFSSLWFGSVGLDGLRCPLFLGAGDMGHCD